MQCLLRLIRSTTHPARGKRKSPGSDSPDLTLSYLVILMNLWKTMVWQSLYGHSEFVPCLNIQRSSMIITEYPPFLTFQTFHLPLHFTRRLSHACDQSTNAMGRRGGATMLYDFVGSCLGSTYDGSLGGNPIHVQPTS